jgi:hypothetical protein
MQTVPTAKQWPATAERLAAYGSLFNGLEQQIEDQFKNSHKVDDHYSLVYITKDLLGRLVAFAGRESLNESWTSQPDQVKIAELEAFGKEVMKMRNRYDYFNDSQYMQDLLDYYIPISKEATRLSLAWAEEREQDSVYQTHVRG